MKNKLSALLLTLALAVLALPMAAFAEGDVAQIGDKTYPTLQAAVDTITDNTPTTITLLASFKLTDSVNVPAGRNITIEGAQNTITLPDSVTFGGVTAFNEKTSMEGLKAGTTLTVNNVQFQGNTPDTAAGHAVIVGGQGDVTVSLTGCTFTDLYDAVYCNHVSAADAASTGITITGSTFSNVAHSYGWDDGSTSGARVDKHNFTLNGNTDEPDPETFSVASVAGVGYKSLDEAIAAAKAAADKTVTLRKDAALTAKVEVTDGLTIVGNGHAISGKADDKGVYFEVTDGVFNISDVTLKDFGGAVNGASGDAVIKVPASATNPAVNATNVKVENFARSAYDIRSGSFAITGGSINCANNSTQQLTKGILAGLGANTVTGTVKDVAISNSASNYADWNTAAIEVYNNANVKVEGGSITNTPIGVHVDNYWGAKSNVTGDAVVSVNGTTINATDYALRTYGPEDPTANKANVSIKGGSFTGKIGQTDPSAGETILITGGTFSEQPDSSFVVPGYKFSGNSVVADPWEPLPTATPAPGAAPAAGVLDSTPKTGDMSFGALALAGLAFAALGVAAKRKLH